MTEQKPLLPFDPKERKAIPLASGVLDYFPSALIEVAKVSQLGNDQHNPGQPLHWSRGKSFDHADTMQRHLRRILKSLPLIAERYPEHFVADEPNAT